MAFEQPRVLGEELLGPAVELQVHRLGAQLLAQLLVFALPVLPAGGDHRHRAGDAQAPQCPADSGTQPLRAEQDEVRRWCRG